MIQAVFEYLKEYKKAIKYIDTTIDNKFLFIAFKPWISTKDIFSIIEKMQNEKYYYKSVDFDLNLKDITIYFHISKNN